MPRRTSTDNTKSNNDQQEEVSYAIISTDNWNISNHKTGPAKPNKSGQGKSAPFTYNGKRFYLKVPKMFTPFGASFPKPMPGKPAPENPKWSCQMAFGDDPACQSFQKKVEEFDEWMIDQACLPENQVSWLNASKTKLFSRDVVESKYSRMIKYSMKDGERQAQYPPFVRANYTTVYNEPTQLSTEFYDKENQPMSVSLDPNSLNHISKKVPPACSVSGLLQGSIWANALSFGVTWSFAQIKVFPSKGLAKGKCMLGDPEDDVEEEEDEQDPNTEDKDEVVQEEDETQEDEAAEEVEEEVAEEEAPEEAEEVTEEVVEEEESQPEPVKPVVAKTRPTPSKKVVAKAK